MARRTRSTVCFRGQEDDRSEGRAMAAALRETIILTIADLVLKNLDPLLDDLSLLLLRFSRLPRAGAPPISRQYAKLYGGDLSAEQQKLAVLLDALYSVTDPNLLSTRRGAVLECLVFHAVSARKKQVGDEVIHNLDYLRFPDHNAPKSNGYSVDVIACFPRHRMVEMYACKLHTEHMPENDLRDFDGLGEYFSERRTVVTAFGCLEYLVDVDEDFQLRRLKYPDIELIALEDFPTLLDEWDNE